MAVKLVTKLRIICRLLLLVGILSGCSAKSDSFQEFVSANTLPAISANFGFEVVHFGTSSFLVDDGNSQILVDGFVTRKRHRYLGKIAPSAEAVERRIADHEICYSPKSQYEHNNHQSCRSPLGRGLELIIPTHAHYDHALDAPYFAAITGAALLTDSSIDALVDASSQYDGFQLGPAKWDIVKSRSEDIFQNVEQKIRVIYRGAFKITLIEIPHSRNISTPFVSGIIDEINFPANLWKFKEGTSISVLIEHGNRSLLIIPSSGAIGDTFRENNIKANVVMLGIGNLGRKSHEEQREYWNDAVLAVGAERVFPVHWDDDQYEYNPSLALGNFKQNEIFGSHNLIIQFRDFIEEGDKEIFFAPAEVAFNPFVGLKAN